MANPNDTGTASMGRAVTKSDSTVLPVTRALYIGGAGDVAVKFEDDPAGTAVTLAAAAAGTVLPVRVVKVMSTNTTATSIVALY